MRLPGFNPVSITYQWLPWVVHLLFIQQQPLSVYSVPGIVLGTRDIAVSKKTKMSALVEFIFEWREINELITHSVLGSILYGRRTKLGRHRKCMFSQGLGNALGGADT